MSIESEVSNLTAQTTALLSAVNVAKSLLDQKVTAAAGSADLAAVQTSLTSNARDIATAQAVLSAGSASQALAIYGTTNALSAALATAAAQSQLAQTAAASASSILQQDLSAVSAALHRSPNAVTAMCLYDTSKDSDGGAWIERMQHTSWYNESLNGAWRGAVASEAACRAISGATTGDYFQLTTDGKFYKLNATSGVTEVFRGNTAKFPRLAMIVAEASNITIYDLSQPGRPMWMRLSNSIHFWDTYSGRGITTVAAIQSKIAIGVSSADIYSGNGLTILDFASSDLLTINLTDGQFSPGKQSGFTSAKGIRLYGGVAGVRPFNLVNYAVNAVAMTILPDAPIDIATGLQIPTIAVSSSGGGATGVSIIKHDGTVVIPPNTYISGNIAFIAQGDVVVIGENAKNIRKAIAPAYTSTVEYRGGPLGLQGPGYPINPDYAIKAVKNTMAMAARNGGIYLLRDNPSNTGKYVAAQVAGNFNTGHLLGDIRRAYLCNTEVESVAVTELVTNGTFDTDITGWNAAMAVFNSGKLRVTGTSGINGLSFQGFATVMGKTYRITGSVTPISGDSCLAVGTSGGAENLVPALFSTQPQTISTVFTAINTYTYVNCYTGPSGIADFDNISVKEVIADRSYKAAGASIYGTLVKSVVA